jgi:hypothetical protein
MNPYPANAGKMLIISNKPRESHLAQNVSAR